MGSCVSKRNELTEYLQRRLLVYPGSRVYLSQLIIQWVWYRECNVIFDYIREEDPLNLKRSLYSIKHSLDCVGRYRKKKNLPFLTKEEQKRYDLIMKERQSGVIYIHPIQKIVMNKKNVEFLDDCKLI